MIRYFEFHIMIATPASYIANVPMHKRNQRIKARSHYENNAH